MQREGGGASRVTAEIFRGPLALDGLVVAASLLQTGPRWGELMKVMRLGAAPGKPLLREDEAPIPVAGAGELLIRVCAAGITPSEVLWYPTTHTKTGESRRGAVPSHVFSSMVVAAGAGADGFNAGQEVYGMNDWFRDGALAEFCVAPASSVAPKPTRLSHAEAASVPIGALTAWQGLVVRAAVGRGERVLVHGGAGAVGLFAVQVARHRGAHVVATASAANVEFVMALGADEVIDYKAERFEKRVQDVDVVFDTVGGETLRRSWSLLKTGGRMVTIAANGESTTDERVKQAFFIVEPNQEQLVEIARLLDSGEIRTAVDAVTRFSRAAEAYSGRVEGRAGRGKVVVEMGG